MKKLIILLLLPCFCVGQNIEIGRNAIMKNTTGSASGKLGANYYCHDTTKKKYKLARKIKATYNKLLINPVISSSSLIGGAMSGSYTSTYLTLGNDIKAGSFDTTVVKALITSTDNPLSRETTIMVVRIWRRWYWEFYKYLDINKVELENITVWQTK